MKVLCTGSEGFIGSNLKQRLIELGHEVVEFDLKNGNDIRLKDLGEGYKTIYHLAAKASIPDSFDNPVEAHSHNVVGTLRVLELAKRIKANVVFSSSSSVYGEPDDIPTHEDSKIDPVSPYATQKYICEQYLRLYWKLGVKSVALRYFNVYGDGQEKANGGYSLALAKFMNQKKRNVPLTIVGTGEQKRDFVNVKDVVDANIKAAQWLDTATGFESFNIGSGENISINDLAKWIDPKGKREWLPPRPEPLIGLADITKSKQLGWKPKHKLKQWIEENL